MTPQELKASVLLYALQGRLVAHDPSEGTGRDEIEKMLRHKELLQKNKEIKKEKPIPPVTDNEITSDIPDNWCWERIGNIGSWSAGATPPRTNPDYYGGDIPWLKTGDLNDGIVSSVPEYITDLALQKTSVRLNPIGSVLMAMYGATIGKLGILDTPMTTNQACCACIPYEGMFNKYLFYFLMGNRLNFIKMGEGGAQPNISKEKIVNFPIAVPPLAEQRRIVAKLEEILPLIDRYEAAWNKLEEFNKRFPGDMQKSILQLAIQGKLVEQRPEEGAAVALKAALIQKKQEWVSAGAILKKADTKAFYGDEDLFDIPDTWEWVQLSDVSIIQEGAGIRKWQYRNDGTQILCVTNILDGSVDLDKKRLYISTEEYLEKYTHLTLKKGDIVTSCSGGSWGKIAFFDSDETLMLNTSTLRMRFFDDLADNNYLYYVCKSPFFKRQLELQLSGMQPNFGYAHYSRIVFPLPPLAEQRRIVAKLEEILPLCDRLK